MGHLAVLFARRDQKTAEDDEGPEPDSGPNERIQKGRTPEVLSVESKHALVVGKRCLERVRSSFQIMDCNCRRQVDHPPSRLPCPEAPIHVLAEEKEPLIQKADPLARFASNRKKRARDPVHLSDVGVVPVA